MSIRRAILTLILALSLTGLTSCLTPSVPIPPPEPEYMVFTHDPVNGEASFTFDPAPTFANAIVYIFNRDQGVGIIETAAADGSVGPTRTFSAELDDRIVVTFDIGVQLAATCVRLQDGRSSSALECDQ